MPMPQVFVISSRVYYYTHSFHYLMMHSLYFWQNNHFEHTNPCTTVCKSPKSSSWLISSSMTQSWLTLQLHLSLTPLLQICFITINFVPHMSCFCVSCLDILYKLTWTLLSLQLMFLIHRFVWINYNSYWSLSRGIISSVNPCTISPSWMRLLS